MRADFGLACTLQSRLQRTPVVRLKPDPYTDHRQQHQPAQKNTLEALACFRCLSPASENCCGVWWLVVRAHVVREVGKEDAVTNLRGHGDSGGAQLRLRVGAHV